MAQCRLSWSRFLVVLISSLCIVLVVGGVLCWRCIVLGVVFLVEFLGGHVFFFLVFCYLFFQSLFLYLYVLQFFVCAAIGCFFHLLCIHSFYYVPVVNCFLGIPGGSYVVVLSSVCGLWSIIPFVSGLFFVFTLWFSCSSSVLISRGSFFISGFK